MHSLNKDLNRGPLSKTDILYMDSVGIDQPEDKRDKSFDLFFTSESQKAFYYYAIEKHFNFFKLRIQFSRKSQMIKAAKTGDLNNFKLYFTDTEKMVGFSMDESIRLGRWNIVEFLISLNKSYEVYNAILKKSHIKIINNHVIWGAIRWNQVLILENAMALNYKPTKDWLAYCIYNNSIDVARYFLAEQRYHLNFKKSNLQTDWYQRKIRKENQTSKFVKNVMNSWI